MGAAEGRWFNTSRYRRRARRTWSPTVVNGICTEAATWRRLRPSCRLSRRMSLILRMLIWGRGTGTPSNGLGRQFEQGALPSSRQRYVSLRAGCTKTPESVYGFDRNGCTKTPRALIRLQVTDLPVGVAVEPDPTCPGQ